MGGQDKLLYCGLTSRSSAATFPESDGPLARLSSLSVALMDQLGELCPDGRPDHRAIPLRGLQLWTAAPAVSSPFATKTTATASSYDKDRKACLSEAKNLPELNAVTCMSEQRRLWRYLKHTRTHLGRDLNIAPCPRALGHNLAGEWLPGKLYRCRTPAQRCHHALASSRARSPKASARRIASHGARSI